MSILDTIFNSLAWRSDDIVFPRRRQKEEEQENWMVDDATFAALMHYDGPRTRGYIRNHRQYWQRFRRDYINSLAPDDPERERWIRASWWELSEEDLSEFGVEVSQKERREYLRDCGIR